MGRQGGGGEAEEHKKQDWNSHDGHPLSQTRRPIPLAARARARIEGAAPLPTERPNLQPTEQPDHRSPQVSETRHARVLIIGSGPAGYTAAVYASRALLDPVLLQGLQPGGQLTITTEVENWPSVIETQGPALMEHFEAHARAVGTEVIADIVTSLDLSRRPFVATCDSGAVWHADAVILATGAQARWLGLPSEEKFMGFGVSACATCDGFFYRGRQVLVIGGGNTAVEEALYLANLASKVTLVHRRDTLRAEAILRKRLLEHPKIVPLWDHTLEEVLGSDTDGVTGARLKHVRTGGTTDIAAAGIFIAIGHSPASELVKDQLETHMGGYVVTAPDSTETSIAGVFAAGDVTDHVYRQAVTSAGLGCMAALEAEKFLAALPAAAQEAAE